MTGEILVDTNVLVYAYDRSEPEKQVRAMSFWDAQIWAVARLNQIPVIFSEDFNSGATLEGVHFVNPFSSSFRLEDWA